MRYLILLLAVISVYSCTIAGTLDPDKVGCSHVGGLYNFTSHDYLNEGAITIYDIGFRVVKVWFNNDVPSLYPYNSSWPQFNSLKELAQTQYFVALFSKPFTTFILEAYSTTPVYWQDGMSAAETDIVYNEFRELSKYLCQTYYMSGKTFILQDWEGDNALGQNAPLTAVQGMIDWLNARQDGIAQGRIEGGMTGVLVVGAAECNKIWGSPWSGYRVVNAVFPYTHMDLYSYSCWEAKTDQTLLLYNLNALKANAPDSSLYGEWNIYVGECGLAELDFGSQAQKDYTQMQVESSLNWGARFAVYWQVYCNGINGSLNGWWLVRDDCTLPQVWNYFYNGLN